jgi:hypothetical protein
MKRFPATLIAPVLLTLLLSPAPALSEPATQPALRPNCPPLLARAEAPDGIRVTLELEDTRVPVGTPVKMTIRVRNEGSTPVSYSHSGQEYDFWVRDGKRNVWVWSANKVFLQFLQEETLEPGEERSASVRWSQRTCKTGSDGTGPRQDVRAGRYVARGLWMSGPSESWWSPRVDFTVTP